MDNKSGENIFNNIHKLEKQMPSEAFLLKMESYAKTYGKQALTDKINKTSLVGLAASLLVLFLLNGYAISNTNSHHAVLKDSESYDLLATQFLYDE